jgi:MFS family permease
LLLSSSFASTIGDWLDFVAILVLVSVVWRRGASGLATVSVAIALPNLAAPLVGVFVDRYQPRALMVGSDLVRAAVTAGMAFAPNVWMLAALLTLRSAASTAFGPARQTVLRQAIDQDNRVQANASMQVVGQTLKIVGPTVGGALLAVLSPRTVIGINAASFVASALILTALRVPAVVRPAGRSSYAAELREGLEFIRHNSALKLAIVALGGTVFLTFLYDSMLALAVPGLGLDRSYIGYLISAVGVGGVLGAVLLAQWGARIKPFVLIGAGQLAVGALISLMGAGADATIAPPDAAWLAVALLIGVAAAGVVVGYPTVVQTVTPDYLMGRTWTAIAVVPALLQVIAPVVGATILTAIGVGPLFLISGAGLVLLAVLTLFGQRLVWPAEPAAQGAAAATVGTRGESHVAVRAACGARH